MQKNKHTLQKKSIPSFISILISISLIFVFSSCDNKGTGGLRQNQVSPSPEQASESCPPANPSDDREAGPYAISKEELDTALPYLKIYDAYGTVSYVQLDGDTADDLSKDLTAMEETDLSEYVGTEKDYFPENIYLYIGNKLKGEQTDFGSGYSVLMNSEGNMCLRDFDEEIDYRADDVCERLLDISKQAGVIPYITKENISLVTKAELKLGESKQVEITDKETLGELERMFRNAERIVNPGTYNISAVLTLTNAEGECVDIELDEFSDICVIGHSYWYDYGPGTDGDNSRNSQKELFKLLGITAWTEK